MAGDSVQDEDRGEGDIMTIPGANGNIDASTFDQILEMDDDEDERDFSKQLVYDFFTQADTTFDKMNVALKAKDFKTLSDLGHFLKGSSATLGLTKVKDSCEKIQHYGQKKDEAGTNDITEDDALKLLRTTIEQAKDEFADVEKVLKVFYHDKA